MHYFLGRFGLRDVGQQDTEGFKYLNLDQLARPDAVEHDVSLSRRDYAQGDNCTPQKDLVAAIVSSSTNGKVITTEDFAALRCHRLRQQKLDNPHLVFGGFQLVTACGEVALVQTLFGVGFPKYSVPVSYMKALFEEERLPVRKGWSKRRLVSVGFIESLIQLLRLLPPCMMKIRQDQSFDHSLTLSAK